ncbi:SigE family RNA polymerase sigma factor [Nocardioides aquiterrae]|uniref:SigE family RNA polymerase sigma factor n=1 Tax=Nocardioides aquiterrae TaxID=203799 RepID=A0ABP4F4Y1_9ACTN
MRDSEQFAEFVSQRSPALLRAAWLLTGDWHLAQDLVQVSLEKSWPRWGREVEHPEAYVRRVMLTTYLSWRRRRWTGEVPTADVPEQASAAGGTDLRLSLLTALATLPPRQRAVLVLRYFEDLTEQQAADALGCSVGTVKAHASRGLQHLRLTPGLAEALGEGARDGR